MKLGRGGVEEIIRLNLTDGELADLKKSAAAVGELVAAVKRLNYPESHIS